ncbi:MAG: YqeG family HAD IIIA-type phosphatase [Candidatus Margulisiibacteriota bacterium]|nr:YqeG family HAD IIIA-type phosphatase [Candidatus Margulisiibacteriota bacterium]
MNWLQKIFKPDQILNNIHEIDFEKLKKMGINSLLLDIDDTLIPRNVNDVSPRVFEWVAMRKEEGFKLCIISNSRHPIRVKFIGETLDIPAIPFSLKPLPFVFLKSFKLLNSKPEECAMIGDQIFMDILGAKFLKIHTIFVKYLTEETFWLRKWMRRAERWTLDKVL